MLAIEDYALVGDCHGSALVGRDGSVGWCCFGRFDADPALFGLLDSTCGGRFTIAPPDASANAQRSYLRGTNVLETVFVTPSGRASVVDFMPVGRKPGSGVHDYTALDGAHALVRRIVGLEGVVRVKVSYRPSKGFRSPAADHDPNGASGGPRLSGDVPWQPDGNGGTQADVELHAGECRYAVLAPERELGARQCEGLLEVTTCFWREWVAYCRYRGPYGAVVERSALALKALTYAPSGAIVAAPTTSLPEWIGGERNWDYRYCWIRDACFTLYALAMLGYSGEARRFSNFLKRIGGGTTEELQIMYGIEAETRLEERVLAHLGGYRGSRPVRIGNGAYRQRQTDVYGEYADWALLNTALCGTLDDHGREMLGRVADLACRHASEPEEGIWEMRGPPRHHVLGKIMCWVALDRALRLLEPRQEWVAKRQELREEILRRGVREGVLVQAYDADATDAALLLVPLLAFPVDREVLAGTVDAIERELGRGDLLLRYATSDGVAGEEGAFLACGFWRVDALLALGRYPEAVRLFERLVARANDVGLFAEEVDAGSGVHLGNFPQALTHLALVMSAVHLDLYELGGAGMLAGTLGDRASRAVGATFGWRALWEAFKASRRVGRLRSSRDSIMDPALLRRGD